MNLHIQILAILFLSLQYFASFTSSQVVCDSGYFTSSSTQPTPCNAMFSSPRHIQPQALIKLQQYFWVRLEFFNTTDSEILALHDRLANQQGSSFSIGRQSSPIYEQFVASFLSPNGIREITFAFQISPDDLQSSELELTIDSLLLSAPQPLQVSYIYSPSRPVPPLLQLTTTSSQIANKIVDRTLQCLDDQSESTSYLGHHCSIQFSIQPPLHFATSSQHLQFSLAYLSDRELDFQPAAFQFLLSFPPSVHEYSKYLTISAILNSYDYSINSSESLLSGFLTTFAIYDDVSTPSITLPETLQMTYQLSILDLNHNVYFTHIADTLDVPSSIFTPLSSISTPLSTISAQPFQTQQLSNRLVNSLPPQFTHSQTQGGASQYEIGTCSDPSLGLLGNQTPPQLIGPTYSASFLLHTPINDDPFLDFIKLDSLNTNVQLQFSISIPPNNFITPQSITSFRQPLPTINGLVQTHCLVSELSEGIPGMVLLTQTTITHVSTTLITGLVEVLQDLSDLNVNTTCVFVVDFDTTSTNPHFFNTKYTFQSSTSLITTPLNPEQTIPVLQLQPLQRLVIHNPSRITPAPQFISKLPLYFQTWPGDLLYWEIPGSNPRTPQKLNLGEHFDLFLIPFALHTTWQTTPPTSPTGHLSAFNNVFRLNGLFIPTDIIIPAGLYKIYACSIPLRCGQFSTPTIPYFIPSSDHPIGVSQISDFKQWLIYPNTLIMRPPCVTNPLSTTLFTSQYNFGIACDSNAIQLTQFELFAQPTLAFFILTLPFLSPIEPAALTTFAFQTQKDAMMQLQLTEHSYDPALKNIELPSIPGSDFVSGAYFNVFPTSDYRSSIALISTRQPAGDSLVYNFVVQSFLYVNMVLIESHDALLNAPQCLPPDLPIYQIDSTGFMWQPILCSCPESGSFDGKTSSGLDCTSVFQLSPALHPTLQLPTMTFSNFNSIQVILHFDNAQPNETIPSAIFLSNPANTTTFHLVPTTPVPTNPQASPLAITYQASPLSQNPTNNNSYDHLFIAQETTENFHIYFSDTSINDELSPAHRKLFLFRSDFEVPITFGGDIHQKCDEVVEMVLKTASERYVHPFTHESKPTQFIPSSAPTDLSNCYPSSVFCPSSRGEAFEFQPVQGMHYSLLGEKCTIFFSIADTINLLTPTTFKLQALFGRNLDEFVAGHVEFYLFEENVKLETTTIPIHTFPLDIAPSQSSLTSDFLISDISVISTRLQTERTYLRIIVKTANAITYDTINLLPPIPVTMLTPTFQIIPVSENPSQLEISYIIDPDLLTQLPLSPYHKDLSFQLLVSFQPYLDSPLTTTILPVSLYDTTTNPHTVITSSTTFSLVPPSPPSVKLRFTTPTTTPTQPLIFLLSPYLITDDLVENVAPQVQLYLYTRTTYDSPSPISTCRSDSSLATWYNTCFCTKEDVWGENCDTSIQTQCKLNCPRLMDPDPSCSQCICATGQCIHQTQTAIIAVEHTFQSISDKLAIFPSIQPQLQLELAHLLGIYQGRPNGFANKHPLQLLNTLPFSFSPPVGQEFLTINPLSQRFPLMIDLDSPQTIPQSQLFFATISITPLFPTTTTENQIASRLDFLFSLLEYLFANWDAVTGINTIAGLPLLNSITFPAKFTTNIPSYIPIRTLMNTPHISTICTQSTFQEGKQHPSCPTSQSIPLSLLWRCPAAASSVEHNTNVSTLQSETESFVTSLYMACSLNYFYSTSFDQLVGQMQKDNPTTRWHHYCPYFSPQYLNSITCPPSTTPSPLPTSYRSQLYPTIHSNVDPTDPTDTAPQVLIGSPFTISWDLSNHSDSLLSYSVAIYLTGAGARRLNNIATDTSTDFEILLTVAPLTRTTFATTSLTVTTIPYSLSEAFNALLQAQTDPNELEFVLKLVVVETDTTATSSPFTLHSPTYCADVKTKVQCDDDALFIQVQNGDLVTHSTRTGTCSEVTRECVCPSSSFQTSPSTWDNANWPLFQQSRDFSNTPKFDPTFNQCAETSVFLALSENLCNTGATKISTTPVTSLCSFQGFIPTSSLSDSPEISACTVESCICLNKFDSSGCKRCSLTAGADTNVPNCSTLGTNIDETDKSCDKCICRVGFKGEFCSNHALLVHLDFLHSPINLNDILLPTNQVVIEKLAESVAVILNIHPSLVHFYEALSSPSLDRIRLIFSITSTTLAPVEDSLQAGNLTFLSPATQKTQISDIHPSAPRINELYSIWSIRAENHPDPSIIESLVSKLTPFLGNLVIPLAPAYDPNCSVNCPLGNPYTLDPQPITISNNATLILAITIPVSLVVVIVLVVITTWYIKKHPAKKSQAKTTEIEIGTDVEASIHSVQNQIPESQTPTQLPPINTPHYPDLFAIDRSGDLAQQHQNPIRAEESDFAPLEPSLSTPYYEPYYLDEEEVNRLKANNPNLFHISECSGSIIFQSQRSQIPHASQYNYGSIAGTTQHQDTDIELQDTEYPAARSFASSPESIP